MTANALIGLPLYVNGRKEENFRNAFYCNKVGTEKLRISKAILMRVNPNKPAFALCDKTNKDNFLE
jgi:hypothetical protein